MWSQSKGVHNVSFQFPKFYMVNLIFFKRLRILSDDGHFDYSSPIFIHYISNDMNLHCLKYIFVSL